MPRALQWTAALAAWLVMTAAVAPAAHASASPASPRPGSTVLASRSSSGEPGNGGSLESSISLDGRVVAFQSDASNLVADDVNERTDVFVRDLRAGVTERISVSSAGEEANNASSVPTISRDGRYVVFESLATNLAPNDTNGTTDIFVHDRATRTTTRMSESAAGEGAKGMSYNATIAGGGRHVLFSSFAANLVPGDVNGQGDIFIRDLVDGTIRIASLAADGTQGDSASYMGAISGDGRFVAFYSFASNLVPDDTNRAGDAFWRDLASGATERVSVASDGTGANDAVSGSAPPAISDDGRVVAFVSRASNLVPADASARYEGLPFGPTLAYNLFVRDRAVGRTERIDVGNDGGEANAAVGQGRRSMPSMSADGRYLVFTSAATNLTEGAGVGTVAGYVQADIYVHDRLTHATERMSVDDHGNAANGGSLVGSISADGRYVAFSSLASLTPDNNPSAMDVFVRDRGPALGASAALAERRAGTARVSGVVTFSGVSVASGVDPAGDLAAPGGDLIGGDLLYRPETGDLLFSWRGASLPGVRSPAPSSTGAGGAQPGMAVAAAVYVASFAVDATRYEVRASGPSTRPVIQLFSCATRCTAVADLSGGIGTASEEVRVRLPVALLGGAVEGKTLDAVAFQTALADPAGAAFTVLDGIAMGAAPVPVRSVAVGRAPSDARPDEVAFQAAEVADGRFTADLAAAADDAIWLRICFGAECRTRTVPGPPE